MFGRTTAWRWFAWFAGLAAAFHTLHAVGLLPVDESSQTRHLIFVGINLGGAWYALRRPRWLLPAYVVLVAQQTMGHGGRALRWWHESGRVDVISVSVLAVLYTGLALLVRDASDRSPFVKRFARGAFSSRPNWLANAESYRLSNVSRSICGTDNDPSARARSAHSTSTSSPLQTSARYFVQNTILPHPLTGFVNCAGACSAVYTSIPAISSGRMNESMSRVVRLIIAMPLK